MLKKKDTPNQAELNSKIEMHIHEEERNLFKEEHTKRLHMSSGKRKLVSLSIVLVLAYFLVVFVPVDTTNTSFSLAYVLSCINGRLQNFLQWVTGTGSGNGINFVIYRTAIIALVGAALAVCGAVYQGSFKNALASPTTLGVSSGGTLGGMIYILFLCAPTTAEIVNYSDIKVVHDSMSVWQQNIQQMCILAGCFAAVFLIVGVSKIAGKGKVNSVALILAGTVFSSLIGGATGLVQYYITLANPDDSRLDTIRTFMMGSFDRAFTLQHLLMVAIPVIICMAIIMRLRGKLNIIVFGEDEARSLGVKVSTTRGVLIAVCTILTAVCISFCGQIGFVGLMVPHMARYMTGADFKTLIPASALLGGAIMLVVYFFAYMIGYASNLNVPTSIIGGISFLAIMLAFRRKRNADWA